MKGEILFPTLILIVGSAGCAPDVQKTAVVYPTNDSLILPVDAATPAADSAFTVLPFKRTETLTPKATETIVATQTVEKGEIPLRKINYSREAIATPDGRLAVSPGTIIKGAIPTKENKFAMTWDDAGDPRRLKDFLDFLDSLKVRGTFFFPAKFISENPDLIRNVEARGHDVGLHGWDHEPFSKIQTLEEAENIFDRNVAVYIGVLGHRPIFERMPYGDYGNAEHQKWLTNILGPKYGLVFPHWSTSLGDGDKQYGVDPSKLPQIRLEELEVIRKLVRGDYVLSHWMAICTKDNLPELIGIARQRGLESVTFGEMVVVK